MPSFPSRNVLHMKTDTFQNDTEYNLFQYVERSVAFINDAFPKMKDTGFSVEKIRFDYKPNRSAHRGGLYKIKGATVTGVNFAMACIMRQGYGYGGIYDTWEYKSFGKYPKSPIGRFFSYDKNISDEVIAVHEVCHAAQFHAKRLNIFKYDKPHGESFKRFYEPAREELINHRVPFTQEQMEKAYVEARKKAIEKITGSKIKIA